jgi:hypothetical protein
VSLSDDVGITHATAPEGRSIKSSPALHNTSSAATPSSTCFFGVPKIFPNDIAGIIPIERTRGIKVKSIICFRNFDFVHMPKKLSFLDYLFMIIKACQSSKWFNEIGYLKDEFLP